MPVGVSRMFTKFSPAVESERGEYFLNPVDSAGGHVQVAGEIARIANPANGMVIAIDPDIPLRLQRVPLAARGADERMVLRLNGAVLGPASDNVMWAPARGSYVLALEDASGHTLDSARFIVR